MNDPDLTPYIDDIVANVRGGASLDEQVDDFINTTDFAMHAAILDEFGEVDLSEPMPDLTVGWTRIRQQLAYNALYRAASAALKETP